VELIFFELRPYSWRLQYWRLMIGFIGLGVKVSQKVGAPLKGPAAFMPEI
jgi:hypothetical protein